MPAKLTTNQFIAKAKKVHGDRYDYSKVKYENSLKRVNVYCPEHGLFEALPKSHLKGSGCPECGRLRMGCRSLTQEEFIERAYQAHGTRYDYSETKYIDAKTKVKILCPEHGAFKQTPSSHQQGVGCPECANKLRRDAHRLTQAEFLIKAEATHGDKYDYSETEYIDGSRKLKIICKEHGAFWQSGSTHLSGAGCPACGGRPEVDTNEFIMRAMAIHGDKYDYSRSVYVNSKTKIEIICPEHGSFKQTPGNHYRFGCILCGYKNAGQYHKKDTDTFIAEARALHGDKYDYSLVDYKDARKKVRIICPDHGIFEQVAFVHLRSEPRAACERCSYKKRGERARLTFEEFISRAKDVHGQTYNYSETKESYVDAFTTVSIICPHHGKFEQTPVNHYSGQGCPKCGTLRASQAMSKTTEQFILEARKVHGDKYDYSQAKYVGARENITIVCPIDGPFSQIASIHIRGTGCPRCSRRDQGAPRNLTRALRGEFDGPFDAYVYVIEFVLPSNNWPLYKVGSGTGTRKGTIQNEIKSVGGVIHGIDIFPFSSRGEAIIFEHLAHQQIADSQFAVPLEHKFPGYSEVFSKRPVLEKIKGHPLLLRFQSGDRWDPRDDLSRSNE